MSGSDRCDLCDTDELVYRLESDRGSVNRCIECLAIEQLQQQVNLPFEVWIDRDEIEPPDQDKFPDAPEFDPFDPREHSYETVRSWARVLARLKDDDPIVKRDPDAIGTIFEDTRTFLTNFMGSDAYQRPSDLISTGGNETIESFTTESDRQ